jgi:hypothetical protein
MVTFQKLWDNHPTITGDKNPCSTNGRPNVSYSNFLVFDESVATKSKKI